MLRTLTAVGAHADTKVLIDAESNVPGIKAIIIFCTKAGLITHVIMLLAEVTRVT